MKTKIEHVEVDYLKYDRMIKLVKKRQQNKKWSLTIEGKESQKRRTKKYFKTEKGRIVRNRSSRNYYQSLKGKE